MNDWKQARQSYEDTPIPAELEERVQEGIRQGRMRYRGARRSAWRATASIAACLAVLLTALNTFPSFAAAAAEVPVLGGLFQVLTVRSFTDENGDRTVKVEQPGVTSGSFAEQVNAEIQSRVEERLAEGEQVVAKAKEAFLATGGTEEEWTKRDTTISVDYEIKSQTDTTVSFVVESYVSVASAYQEQTFYNLDLEAGRELTLRDVLGEDWIALCNDSIRGQMAAAEDPTVYFDEERGGFSTVDGTTGFYLNQAGNPVVVFPRATVAIGTMGVVEFEIPKLIG